ncbi:MAG TPA: TerC family protein [Methylomirabilota bacterium]|jgi:YjbE family integral membrane protein|nr:TerC family protein [Methylomirabilota bacterium]
MNLDFLLGIGKIVLIDLALAGDNALVIALAVRTLSPRQQFQGRIWGTVGAVALRLAFIFIVTYLLAVPLLQVVGGLLLVWIALKLVLQSESHEGGKVKQGTTLLGAIWVILVADVIMSLDNVIGVAAAAEGDMRLVVFGIALSIPIVVWGSGVLARLMNRYPWIILVAGGILGEVAGKMMLHDQFIVNRFGDSPDAVEFALRIGLALVIMLVGWLVTRRRAAAEDGEVTAR